MAKLKDLAENTQPLIWKSAPKWWLRKNVPFFEEKRATYSPEQWCERVDQLYAYMTSVDKEEPKPSRSCTVCNLEFTSVAFKMLHLKQYSHKLARAKQFGEPAPENPLYCKFCDFLSLFRAWHAI